MLRSPLEALGETRWQTVGVVVALAAALWMAAATVAAVDQLESVSEGWFESFVPAVYLEADVDDQKPAALAEELRDWSQVRDVDIEGPEVAFERLEEHLGDDEVRDLEVDEQMMPIRLVVHPQVWRPGSVEMLARAEALEERDYVVAVDVPSSRVAETVDRGRLVVWAVGAVAVVVLVAAMASLAMLLGRLRERERREHHLLEVFGASPGSLRLASLWRGMFVGAVAGVVAGVAFVGWSLLVDDVVARIAGESAMSAGRSALWASALAGAGLSIGGLVGWLCGRPGGRQDGGQQMESLLEWQRENG